MGLFDRDEFNRVLGAWPGVTLADQWDTRMAKVGGKVFCMLSDAAPLRMVFKCGEASFDILTQLEGIAQPPYLPKGTWVQVQPTSPLSDDDLVAYVRRSHGLVAQGLTRKLRTALGIVIDV